MNVSSLTDELEQANNQIIRDALEAVLETAGLPKTAVRRHLYQVAGECLLELATERTVDNDLLHDLEKATTAVCNPAFLILRQARPQ